MDASVDKSAAQEVLFETCNLSIHYGAHTALRGVDLTIARGRTTAVIGPSGCGKTSLVHCLGRLLDRVPGVRIEGRLLFEGRELYDKGIDMKALRERIGIVFQKPTPFPFSIRKNIELPLREHGVRDRQTLSEILESSLRAVGLWEEVKDRLHHSALALSGGQQQRLCIARALALKPQVLLMDEPCSALDPIASGTVEDLIGALGQRYSIVLVTHNLAQARRIADDAAFFWFREGAGELVEQGPAKKLFSAPDDPLTAAYLSGEKG